MKYKIADMLGNLVLEGTIVQNNTNVNLNEIASGVYYIEISNGKQKAIQKLVIE